MLPGQHRRSPRRLLREGRAGSNTTVDHITVLDQALAQIPDTHRHGTPILLRSDSAGSSHGFLAHIRSLRERHLDIRFSVGAAITEPVRAAITAACDWVPALDGDGSLRDGAPLDRQLKQMVRGWVPAVDTNGDLREHAEVCEITGLFDAAGWPEGTRFVVRRERPHPGAQLSLFDTIEGWRHQQVRVRQATIGSGDTAADMTSGATTGLLVAEAGSISQRRDRCGHPRSKPLVTVFTMPLFPDCKVEDGESMTFRELQAMQVAYELLSPLDASAQRRVVTWLSAALADTNNAPTAVDEPAAAVKPVAEAPTEVAPGEPTARVAELAAAAEPEAAVEPER